MSSNISPHAYVLMAILAAALSYFGFKAYGGLDEWFFLPIFAVAFFWGVANFIRQWRGLSHFYIDKNIRLVPLLRRAVARYVVWMVVLFVGIKFLGSHPYYQRYDKSMEFLDALLDIYFIAGMPYFLLTLIFKASRVEDFYDPAVRLLHILKQIGIGFMVRGHRRFAVLDKAYNRKVLLNLVMRAYFIPFMVVQVYITMDSAIRFSADDFNNYNLMTILVWLSSMLWFMDALVASAGYSIESRWAENRTRSIDMTVGGWLVCMACYEPFNQVTGTLFPFGPFIANVAPESFVFAEQTAIYIFKMVEIALLVALIYSDLSLGPSGVNITLKRLQTRGPYGIIRHPGTVCKLSLWWLQTAFYAQFWASPQLIIGHLAWNALYILRAYTEERHLCKHEEYRAYMARVRYRFIPGVI